MEFSKDELSQELREFMVGFARSVERMFGVNSGGRLLGFSGQSAWSIEPSEVALESASLWKSVSTMYDYGIKGQAHPSFGADGDVGNEFGEAEMFLLGLDSLRLYFEEDEVRIPTLAKRTVRTAMARHLLDGGERYITRDDDEMSGYLSFAEVALLADMDERSVRNAANPKLPDALVSKNFGRRSMIAIEDARRWLNGRKGFVPTQGVSIDASHAAPALSLLTVPYEIMVRVSEGAQRSSLSTAEFLARLLDKHQGDVQ